MKRLIRSVETEQTESWVQNHDSVAAIAKLRSGELAFAGNLRFCPENMAAVARPPLRRWGFESGSVAMILWITALFILRLQYAKDFGSRADWSDRGWVRSTSRSVFHFKQPPGNFPPAQRANLLRLVLSDTAALL